MLQQLPSLAETLAPLTLQGRSVLRQLVLFALALTLPIVAFVAFLLWHFASLERHRLEREASDTAHNIALTIDRELTGLLASLDVLSLSVNLQVGDLEGFHRQASGLERRQGSNPVLRDTAGQELVNPRLPFGEPLPRLNLAIDERVIATGKAQVSDLFVGAVSPRPQFAVVAPIVQDGKVVYLLSLAFEVGRIRDLLIEDKTTATWTIAVVGRDDVVLARNQGHDAFVGKRATDDLIRNTSGREGTWTGFTLEGTPIFGAYARSRLADWRVAVGVRHAELNAPLRRSLWLLGGLGIGILTLSALLAIVFGRRITAPLQALARRAAALGRGEAISPLSTALQEVNAIGEQLAAAAADLREREAELRESNEEIQRFAYIVSHDLRAPLVNIMGFTSELEALRDDLLARLASLRAAASGSPPPLQTETAGPDETLAEDFTEALGFIKASIAKMDRLINAILKLSREGRRAFKPEAIDMTALLNNITASLAHQVDAAGAAIRIEPLPGLISDRLALEQVFSNLLDNALKYLRRGAAGRIEVTGRIAGQRVIYAVRDNGRGIDRKDQERVFELFRRAGAQDQPGEGIGLAHVRALVRRLGGTITLESEPGLGTTFSVVLPRRWIIRDERTTA